MATREEMEQQKDELWITIQVLKTKRQLAISGLKLEYTETQITRAIIGLMVMFYQLEEKIEEVGY